MNKQNSRHKKLNRMMSDLEMLKQFKEDTLTICAWLLFIVGSLGFAITLFVDVIRTTPIEFHWLQVSALGIFLVITLIGIVAISLSQKKEM